jgi:hypothetical protein
MKPSQWLRRVEPASLYSDTKLLELKRYGIKYDPESGVLTSTMHAGHPYSTFGRLASVELLKPKAAMQKARMMGLNMTMLGQRHEDPDVRMVFGYAIATAVWMVVHEITDGEPPSRLVRDPVLKAQLDIEAIEGYGY